MRWRAQGGDARITQKLVRFWADAHALTKDGKKPREVAHGADEQRGVRELRLLVARAAPAVAQPVVPAHPHELGVCARATRESDREEGARGVPRARVPMP